MGAKSKGDLEQLWIIKSEIRLFREGKADLVDLVGDLIGLLDVLESIGGDWKDEFRAEVNLLEMICDGIKDGSISRWKGDFNEDLNHSVIALETMVRQLLDGYLKTSDPGVLDNAIEADSTWLMCPNCNEAWESTSLNAMVICPGCGGVLHNPRKGL
ncbi:MAG: hypothetical protein AB7M93_26020 [Candidatus Obscuribacterales bacterium]